LKGKVEVSIPNWLMFLFTWISFIQSHPLSSQDYAKEVSDYFNSPLVKGVFEAFEAQKTDLKVAWKEMAKIYAPSGNEILRAEYIRDKFETYGVPETHIDSHGNAVGIIQGSDDGPAVVFLGTMDDLATVAELVKHYDKPIHEKEGKLIGPGTNSSATCVSILGLAKLFT